MFLAYSFKLLFPFEHEIVPRKFWACHISKVSAGDPEGS